MIWWIIIVVVIYIIYKFIIAVNKDNKDLTEKRLTERFLFLIEKLNDSVYSGKGTVKEIDERSFNIYNTTTNTILMFFYSTGHLTITWKKNSVRGGDRTFEKQFNDVRNVDPTVQRLIANQFFNQGEAYFKPFGLSGIITNGIKSDIVENRVTNFENNIKSDNENIVDDLVISNSELPFIIEYFAEIAISSIIIQNEASNEYKDTPLESMFILSLVSEIPKNTYSVLEEHSERFPLNKEQKDIVVKEVGQKVYTYFFQNNSDHD